MIASQLPAALKAALDALAHGQSRQQVAGRAEKISNAYRSGGNSRTITHSDDALAYAMARMPATYAATAASLIELAAAKPDFSPASLIDVGAGPGTASWAAEAVLPSLERFVMLDRNPALRDIAKNLAEGSLALHAADYRLGDAAALLGKADAADLVIASYLIGELTEADQRALVDAMWDRAADTLLIVEPGTPAGYARLMTARRHLVARGAHTLAPCPHDDACPLIAPDWCHFAQRLPRSRDHKRLKEADAPFEDEKFSYVALSRSRPAHRPARVLAPPQLSKVEIAAKLCTAYGLDAARIPRRDKPRYAQARRWRWGDAVAHDGK